MKIKGYIAVIAALLCSASLLMSGCFFDEDFFNDDSNSDSESVIDGGNSSVSLEHGTGLREIKITGVPDENPNRQVVPPKAPIVPVKTLDINGKEIASEFYMYRNILTDAGKKAYDQIHMALNNGINKINMNVSVSANDIADVVYAVYYDHPELFWVDSSLSYSYNGSNIVTTVTVNYNGTANNLRQSQKQFQQAISPALQKAATLSSDVQKEKYIHDYLTNTVNYVSGSAYNQSAFSAIVYKQTVCAGYAHAFQYCMQKLGIPAAYVVGYAGEAHAWNLIKLDGDYYCVDVTWDDPLNNSPNTYYYDYFNLTDAQLSRDHTRQELSVYLPAANGTKYAFNNVFSSKDYGSNFSDLTGFTGLIPSDYDENGHVISSTKPVSSSSTQPVSSSTKPISSSTQPVSSSTKPISSSSTKPVSTSTPYSSYTYPYSSYSSYSYSDWDWDWDWDTSSYTYSYSSYSYSDYDWDWDWDDYSYSDYDWDTWDWDDWNWDIYDYGDWNMNDFYYGDWDYDDYDWNDNDNWGYDNWDNYYWDWDNYSYDYPDYDGYDDWDYDIFDWNNFNYDDYDWGYYLDDWWFS